MTKTTRILVALAVTVLSLATFFRANAGIFMALGMTTGWALFAAFASSVAVGVLVALVLRAAPAEAPRVPTVA